MLAAADKDDVEEYAALTVRPDRGNDGIERRPRWPNSAGVVTLHSNVFECSISRCAKDLILHCLPNLISGF